MAFQYGVLLVMISIFPKLTSFRKEQLVLVVLKEVSPVLSGLKASDNTLWKSITTSTEGPLVHLLPPSKIRLLRNRGHSYFLPQIRTERFKRCSINRCPFYFISSSIVIQNVCFLELIKSFFI